MTHMTENHNWNNKKKVPAKYMQCTRCLGLAVT